METRPKRHSRCKAAETARTPGRVRSAIWCPGTGTRPERAWQRVSPKARLDGRRLSRLGGPAAWIVVARELEEQRVQGLAALGVERGQQLVPQALDDRAQANEDTPSL